MSRKDFELIAATIKRLQYTDLNEKARKAVAIEFADALRGTNANFKRDRFLTACGVTE